MAIKERIGDEYKYLKEKEQELLDEMKKKGLIERDVHSRLMAVRGMQHELIKINKILKEEKCII